VGLLLEISTKTKKKNDDEDSVLSNLPTFGGFGFGGDKSEKDNKKETAFSLW